MQTTKYGKTTHRQTMQFAITWSTGTGEGVGPGLGARGCYKQNTYVCMSNQAKPSYYLLIFLSNQ